MTPSNKHTLRRIKLPASMPVAFYHCVSRVVERRFHFKDREKENFVRILRAMEAFCGVQVVTFCVMSNHFHVLVHIPARPEVLPSDSELVALVRRGFGKRMASDLAFELKELRAAGHHERAEEIRTRYFARMWDLSAFMREVKLGFSRWFNKTHDRKGTLWEERFASVLVEGAGSSVATMAAYIDLNPIRAGIVGDPKDYRWCGYAEAVAGNRRAQAGIKLAAVARRSMPISAASNQRWEEAHGEYRVWLYHEGREVLGEDGRSVKRRGISSEKVEKVSRADGRLSRFELLRTRVRHFSEGAVLGSREFVDAVFVEMREHFGPKRKSGARKIRGMNRDEALFTLRDLQE